MQFARDTVLPINFKYIHKLHNSRLYTRGVYLNELLKFVFFTLWQPPLRSFQSHTGVASVQNAYLFAHATLWAPWADHDTSALSEW